MGAKVAVKPKVKIGIHGKAKAHAKIAAKPKVHVKVHAKAKGKVAAKPKVHVKVHAKAKGKVAAKGKVHVKVGVHKKRRLQHAVAQPSVDAEPAAGQSNPSASNLIKFAGLFIVFLINML